MQKKGVPPFLCPHLCSIYCGRLHCQPGLGLCRLSQSMCALDRGPFQCRRQCLFRPMLAPLPNCRPNLPEAGRVFCCPELHLAPEFCNEVSCDDTGRRPFLRACLSWVRKGLPCLFYWHSGDPYLRCAFTRSFEQSRHKGLLQKLLHRAEGVANAWVNKLHECPLLLE